MKAVIYARVSSREQEETGYSLSAQEKLLREYAERLGLEVIKVFSVAESASGAKQRQVFGEMMLYLEKKGVNNLLCEKVDRLTRNLKEAVIANDWIEKEQSRKIHFVKQSLVIHRFAKSDEKFRWDIEIVLAKKFISNLSEEVKKGQKEKISQGWIPMRAKLGYKTVGDRGKKIHVLDQIKAPFMREMFELYSSGQYSLRELCRVMYKKGLRTHQNNTLVKSRMAEMLADPFYYGTIQWNDELKPGSHEALISKPLFDQVQHVLGKGSSPKYSKHAHTFKGLIKCAECGGTITWEEKKKIVYGHCNFYKPCTSRPWYKEKEVTSKIASAFGQLVIKSKRLANLLRDMLKDKQDEDAQLRSSKLSTLQGRVEYLNRKLDTLYNDRLDGRIPSEVYDRRAREIEEEKKDLQGEIARSDGDADETRELRMQIYELSQAAPQVFEKADLEKKRLLMNLIFEKIEIKGDELTYTFKEPFAILARAAEEANSSKATKLVKSPIQILEPIKNGSTKGRKSPIDPQITTLLRGQDSNLEPTPYTYSSYY
jgi:site-specific DNA recombinase